MSQKQSFPCSNCGKPVLLQNTQPGDQIIICCPYCGASNAIGIGRNIKADDGYRQSTEPDYGPSVLGLRKAKE